MGGIRFDIDHPWRLCMNFLHAPMPFPSHPQIHNGIFFLKITITPYTYQSIQSLGRITGRFEMV